MGDISSILPQLSFEMIIEILSWMPVKSLLKFKCVRKQWSFLTEDNKFVGKHLDRSTTDLRLSGQYRYCEADKTVESLVLDENFIYLTSCLGLLVEQSCSSPQVIRIRNPATRQVLYLPDTPGDMHLMNLNLFFNSATGECKVVQCIRRRRCKVTTGFRVMATGKDEQWRFLKAPNQNDKAKRYTWLDNVEGAAHLVDIITDGQVSYVEVQSLDVWSECFTTNTLPRGVFADLSKVHAMLWNHRIAVVEIVEEALHVLVLEDFKQHKWSKSMIIFPLKFLEDRPHLKDQIRPTKTGSYKNGVEYVRFYERNGRDGWKYILSCNMKGEIVDEARPYKTDGTQYSFVLENASLIALKGMKPESSYNQK